MRNITYIITPICEAYVGRFVYTLYKYSKPDSFNLVVIDQTKDGFSKPTMDYLKDKVHLYMHPKRNLGYAKAMNEGVLHGLHWKTPYICISNDDIEIMDKRWLKGIMDTFALDEERILGVIPMSPRVAGWGYGVDYNPEVLPYKEEYTKEDYDFLLKGDFSNVTTKLPDTHPRQMNGMVVDGGAFVMVYFKREAFTKIGLLDEHFFPGSGEDYDWLARAYKENYRVVSTSHSWIWHHWTKSKDLFASGELEHPYYKPADKPYWNNMGELWPEGHDVWARGKDGKILPRIPEIFVDQI